MKPAPAPRLLASSAALLLAAATRLCAQSGVTDSAPVATSPRPPPGGVSDPTLNAPLIVERAGRAPIFFPPFPPPLDTPIGRIGTLAPGRPAPAEASGYVGDIFYPQLATRFQSRSLPPKLAKALADYTAKRRTLLQEIRATIASTRDADVGARQQAFRALAQRQAPALATWDALAEQLRADLIATDRDWSDYREWHLTDNERRGFSPMEIGSVMRAYAHYAKHLTLPQRELLREVAIDFAAATDDPKKAAAQTTVFFQPATARVVLPAELSAETVQKLNGFFALKARLKKELYDAVAAADGRSALFGNPLRSLAAKQRKDLDELERLAEEIRTGIGGPPPPAPPPRSPLPQSLIGRLATLVEDRARLEQTTHAKVEARLRQLRQQRAPFTVNYRLDDTGLKFVVRPFDRGQDYDSADLAQKMEALQAEFTEMSEAFGRALADYVNATDAIRREAGQILGQSNLRAIDVALSTALRNRTQRDSAEAYNEYRLAVFQPGMSPSQRRLLLSGAIEALQLPLPAGEMQPQGRRDTW